ncbi:hypothetical protein PVT71_26195 (plasmid) [Salipiger sp. H15]|uniref:NADP-dependent oxidoreductase domain-containing protein n=1 Tax=Alloyangia sp. H15 TaxID=3029062 RepID=A0AAU8ATW4_9RHOB
MALEDLVKTVAAEEEVTPTQIALAWLLGQSPSIPLISGTTKAHRIDEGLSGEPDLTAENLASITTAEAAILVEGDRLPDGVLKVAGL